ncbi:hypothetical protein ABZX12_25930 [Kribbella sp. NPDC003505]|uniref:hypothetical protein n=1 Tax=Kribbella sp. NPDC003505 TaxID=3154448 RepID=UPI0033BD4F92
MRSPRGPRAAGRVSTSTTSLSRPGSGRSTATYGVPRAASFATEDAGPLGDRMTPATRSWMAMST